MSAETSGDSRGGGTIGRLLNASARWHQATHSSADDVLSEQVLALLVVLRKAEQAADSLKTDALRKYVAAACKCRTRLESWSLLQRRLRSPGAGPWLPRNRETNIRMAVNGVDETKKLQDSCAPLRAALSALRAEVQEKLDGVDRESGEEDTRLEPPKGAVKPGSAAAQELSARLSFYNELNVKEKVREMFKEMCEPPPPLMEPHRFREVMAKVRTSIHAALSSDAGVGEGVEAAKSLPDAAVSAVRQVESNMKSLVTKHALFMAAVQRLAVEHGRGLRNTIDFVQWACAAADEFLQRERARLQRYTQLRVEEVSGYLERLPGLKAQADDVELQVVLQQAKSQGDAAQLRALRRNLVSRRSEWRREAEGIVAALSLYPELQLDDSSGKDGRGALRFMLDLATPLPLRTYEEFDVDYALTKIVKQFSATHSTTVVGKHPESPHPVVLKALRVPDSNMRAFEGQARVLTSLEDLGIAHLQAVVTRRTQGAGGGREERYVAIPYFRYGNITNYMEEHAGGHLATEDLLDVVAQTCRTLATCHVHGIVHSNLKATNLLVDSSPGGGLVGFLSDFELAADVDRPRIPAGGRGSHRHSGGLTAHLAPEVISDWELRRTPAADIYALGVLMTQLIGEEEQTSPSKVVLVGDAAPLSGLVQKMISEDPAARPTAAEVFRAISSGTPRPRHLQPAAADALDKRLQCIEELLVPAQWRLPRLPEAVVAEIPPRYVDVTDAMRQLLEPGMGGLRVSSVKRNEHPALWHSYAARRQEIAAASPDAAPRFATDDVEGLRGLLFRDGSAANERWMFLRGARSTEAACAILEDGIPVPMCPRGVFGYGIDLTDSAQAAVRGSEGGYATSAQLSMSMMSSVSVSQGPASTSERSLLLCRVCLGSVEEASGQRPCLRAPPSGKHSVAGECDGDKACFVYATQQVFPEFMVVFSDED